MLILIRRANEAIRINEDIEIRILSHNDSQVKLGIEAPKEINILRSELKEQEVPD